MKNKKSAALSNFIVTLTLGWLGIHKFIKGKIGMGILYLCTFGLFYIGYIYDTVKAWQEYSALNTATVPQNNTKSYVNPSAAKSTVPEGEMNYDLFYDVEQNAVLSYEYENNICLDEGAFELVRGNGGKELTFKQEPENAYDKEAVAIYLGHSKLGYVYHGVIQDMINDYIKRGWHFRGYINKYQVQERKAMFKIGFYKPFDQLESKTFSLTKVKKKIDEDTKRVDNLAFCKKGDILTIEYNDYDDVYVVYNDCYEEIGELPATATDFLDEESYKKIVGVLLSLKEDDEEKVTGAKIEVYLVK